MLPSHVSAVRPLLRLLAAQGAHTLLSLRASCGQMLVLIIPWNPTVKDEMLSASGVKTGGNCNFDRP